MQWVHRFPEPEKIVHDFRNTKSKFMLLSAKTSSYFSAQECVKVSAGFAVVSQITSNN